MLCKTAVKSETKLEISCVTKVKPTRHNKTETVMCLSCILKQHRDDMLNWEL